MEMDELYKIVDVDNTVASDIDHHFKNPLYDNLQLKLRQENKQGDVTTNAYTLSLKPLAWGQYGQEKELNREYAKLSKYVKNDQDSQACLNKHRFILEYFYTQNSLDYYIQLNKNYDDLIRILKKDTGRDMLGFNELLKTQERQLEAQTSLSTLEQNLINLQRILSKSSSPSNKYTQQVNFNKFVTINDIKDAVDTLGEESFELKRYELIAKIEGLELDINTLRDNQVVNSYDIIQKQNEFESSIAFEVSFNIPTFNKKSSLNNIIKRQRAIYELNNARREKQNEFQSTKTVLLNQINNYEKIANSDYLKDLTKYQKHLTGTTASSPFKIIQVQEKLMKEKLKLINLRYEITKTFFDSLFTTGRLSSCDMSFLTTKGK
jgi:hypothetical protein